MRLIMCAPTFGKEPEKAHYMAHSEGLEPQTPWFEALCSSFKIVINQSVEKRQIAQKRPRTA